MKNTNSKQNTKPFSKAVVGACCVVDGLSLSGPIRALVGVQDRGRSGEKRGRSETRLVESFCSEYNGSRSFLLFRNY